MLPFFFSPFQNMIDDGYAATQILNQLHDRIIEGHLSDKQKSVVAEKMAVSFWFWEIKKLFRDTERSSKQFVEHDQQTIIFCESVIVRTVTFPSTLCSSRS